MKTGILFLLLQSVLLYSTVEAGPGIAENFLPDTVSAQLASGTDKAGGSGGDKESQQGAEFAQRIDPPGATGVLPFQFSPQSLHREAHGIRAPPFLA